MPDPELSEAALEVLRELEALESEPPPVSDDALFRFLVGWLSPMERDRVIDALTRSEALQERLIDVEATLRHETPQSLIGESIDAFRRLATEGMAAFHADASFSFAGLLRRDRLRTGIAQVRSAAFTTLHIGDHVFRVEAEVTPASILVVRGVREPSGPLDGSPEQAWLELIDEVLGPVPLGLVSLTGAQFLLEVPSAGFSLGEGPVPATAIVFRNDSDTEPPTIVAEGRFELRLAATPTITNELLTVLFVPTTDFAGRTLELGLRIGKITAPLGRWPISDTLTTLEVPVPGQPNGPVPPYALSLRIT